jgi:hypothetical protein
MTEERKARFWCVVGLAILIAGWLYAAAQFEAAQPRPKAEIAEVTR